MKTVVTEILSFEKLNSLSGKLASLKQVYAVQDVSKCALVPLGILVELAVVCAELQSSCVDSTLLLGSGEVFAEGTTAAQIGDVCLCHTLTLGLDKHIKSS